MAKSAQTPAVAQNGTEWIDVESTASNPEVLALLAEVKRKQAEAKAARQALEAKLESVIAVPKGKVIAFAYRYGPAWAVVDPQPEKATKAKPKKAKPNYGY